MNTKYCATIGNYDGVHRGHRKVLERLCMTANEEGMETMVITFDKHPLEVICPEKAPKPLISLEEKIRRIYAAGISHVEVMPIDYSFMQQTAYDFMKHTLYEQLGVRVLIIGYDNRFGKRNPAENAETYITYGKEIGIKVIIGPRPEECGLYNGRAISSSLIRQLLADGKETEAKSLMNDAEGVIGR